MPNNLTDVMVKESQARTSLDAEIEARLQQSREEEGLSLPDAPPADLREVAQTGVSPALDRHLSENKDQESNTSANPAAGLTKAAGSVVDAGVAVASTAASLINPFHTEQNMKVKEQFVAGGAKAVQNIGNGVLSVLDGFESWMKDKGVDASHFSKESKNFTFADELFAAPVTDQEKAVKEVGKFMAQAAAFVGGGAAAGTLKAGAAVYGAVAGSAAINFLAFDAKEDNFADMLREHAGLRDVVSEYLAGDEGDSELEGRFKNALVGVLGDVALAGLFKSTVSGIKWARGIRGRSALGKVDEAVQVASKEADQVDNVAAQADPESQVDNAAAQVADDVNPPGVGEQINADGIPKTPIVPETPAGLTYKELAKSGKLPTIEKLINVVKGADGVERVSLNMKSLENMEGDTLSLMKTLAEDMQGTLTRARQGMLLEDGAKQIGISVDSLTERLVGQGFNENEIAVLAAKANSLGQSVEGLIDAAIASGSEEDLGRVFLAMYEARDVLVTATGAGSTAGKTLNATKKFASKNKLKFYTEIAKNSLSPEEALKSMQHLKVLIAENPGTEVAQLYKVLNQSKLTRTADVVSSLVVNGMLSNPKTQLVNAIGNTAKLAKSVADRYMAVAIGSDISLLEANAYALQSFNSLMDGFGILAHNAKVSTRNAVNKVGSKLGIETTKKAGEKLSFAPEFLQQDGKYAIGYDPLRQLDPGKNLFTKGLDLAGKAAQTPGALLQNADEFFKTISYSAEARAQSVRAAKKLGLEGEALFAKADELFNATVKTNGSLPEDIEQLLMTGGELTASQKNIVKQAKISKDIAEAAMETAKQNTYTQDIGGWMEHVHGAIDKAPGAKMLARFTRISINMVDAAIQTNPVAASLEYSLEKITGKSFSSGGIRKAILAGGAERDLALSKMATTTALTGLTVAGAYAGLFRVTGDEAKLAPGRTLNSMRKEAPNSITVGNTTLPLEALGPVGLHFQIAADLHELAGYLDDDQTNEAIALGAFFMSNIAETVTPEFLTDNILQALTLLKTQDGDKFNEMVADLGRSTVPGILRFANRNLPESLGGDSTKRVTRGTSGYKDLKGAWDSIKNTWADAIPGLGKDLPPQRNLFGHAIKYPPGFGPQLNSPLAFGPNSEKIRPVLDEMARLSLMGTFYNKDLPEGETPLKVVMPLRKFKMQQAEVDLTPKQYDTFVQLSAGIGLYSDPDEADPKIPLEKRKDADIPPLQDALATLINSDYQEALGFLAEDFTIPDEAQRTDQTKRAMIAGLVRAYRDQAKKQLIRTEHPEIKGPLLAKINANQKARDKNYEPLTLGEQ